MGALACRLGSRLLAVCLLGLAAGCSTTIIEPAASPPGAMVTADEERCARSGGVWRTGLCDGLGGGGY